MKIINVTICITIKEQTLITITKYLLDMIFKFLIYFLIVARAFGRLTSTARARELVELAHKPENNETKTFTVQWGPNTCIPENRRTQYEKKIVIPVQERPMIYAQFDDDDTGVYTYVYADFREPEMTVNINFWDRGEAYIGFVNCDGSFDYNCDNHGKHCDKYVPIINGGICNHETGEVYSGKVSFYYRAVCGSGKYGIADYVKHSDCFYEIFVCY